MAGLRVGLVQIYSVKQLKMEMARGTPKLCQNPQANAWWVPLFSETPYCTLLRRLQC